MISVGLSWEPLSLDKLTEFVSVPEAGAVSSFLGIARNDNQGESVTALEFEAYEPMALKQLQRVAQGILDKFEVQKVAIWHRLGVVKVGEAAVAIVVSSAHRKAAIEGCALALERLKSDVPVFKKEVFVFSAPRWVANRSL